MDWRLGLRRISAPQNAAAVPPLITYRCRQQPGQGTAKEILPASCQQAHLQHWPAWRVPLLRLRSAVTVVLCAPYSSRPSPSPTPAKQCFLHVASAVTPGVNTACPTTTHCPMLSGPPSPAHSPPLQCQLNHPPPLPHAPPPPFCRLYTTTAPFAMASKGEPPKGMATEGMPKGPDIPDKSQVGVNGGWSLSCEAQLKCVKHTLVRITPHFRLQHAPTTLASQVHEGQPGLQKGT